MLDSAQDFLIKNAVNQACTCGGGGPYDAYTCPACMVWHWYLYLLGLGPDPRKPSPMSESEAENMCEREEMK